MSKVASANARKRIYIGGKIGDLEAELNALEERQRELSSRESIVNLPEQTRAAVQALAQLESRLQEIETSLKGVNSDLTNTGQLPELAKLKAKKSSLEAQQAEVRRAIADSNARLKSVPAAALEQARLQREIDLKAKLFQSLSEQHQLAQIDEQSDARVYQVVDRAHVPVRPARPNLPVNLALSLILGAALGIAINILISDLASEAAGDF
jgi:tyrosine-protein kinase Etk/Wzc